jgi:hypothetical protein
MLDCVPTDLDRMTELEANALARERFGPFASAHVCRTPSGERVAIRLPGEIRYGTRWTLIFSDALPPSIFCSSRGRVLLYFEAA